MELYAPLIEKAEASDGLLQVTAISIANLCAAYILDGQNDKAEAIMHSVEEEERHALLKVMRPRKHAMGIILSTARP